MVELMVALTIGLFLIGGALQVFIKISHNYRAQQSAAHLMESGRTAMELVSRSLRLGGYWECAGWQVGAVTSDLASSQRGIYGDNNISTTGRIAGTDTVRTLQALDETLVSVTADVVALYDSATNTSGTITVSNGSIFDGADEYIVINDCSQANVLQITAVNANVLSHGCTGKCDNQSYPAGSMVLEVQDTEYYIAVDATTSEPSLYRSINGGTGEVLVHGVEDMQVYYGEDTTSDGATNRYVTAEVINAPCVAGTNSDCWLRVNSVRVSLLLRTLEDNVTQSAQTYTHNGVPVTAGDKRLRREFISIVKLRNFDL